jgi:hypothetical protein
MNYGIIGHGRPPLSIVSIPVTIEKNAERTIDLRIDAHGDQSKNPSQLGIGCEKSVFRRNAQQS